MNPRILRSKTKVSILLAMLCATGCHKAPPAAPDKPASEQAAVGDTASVSEIPGVVVDEEAQHRLGLELSPAVASNSAVAVQGTGIVLDNAALAAMLADIGSAREEAAAARDNFERLQKLYADDGNASRQAVETANAQWAIARARTATAEAHARSDWGSQLVDAQGSQSKVLEDLGSGRIALVRAEFPGALPAAAEKLQYTLLTSSPDDPASQRLDFIARSRAPAVAVGGPSVLLRANLLPDSTSLYRPGARLSVIAASHAESRRTVVPAAAAFADSGQFWCYVARPANRFDRVQLQSTERVAEGYPVGAAVKEGDRVVVRGAPLLLSLERGAGSVADGE